MANYYISTTGNNDNPGTESLPWRTIQKAANTAIAGDTVYIKEGTYNEKINIQNSGNQGNYITFTNYPGHIPIIDGIGITFSSRDEGLITIWDKSYIRINGLKIIHSYYAGLYANKSSGGNDAPSHIEFTNNHIEDTWASAILILGGFASNGYGQGCIVSGNNIINGHNQNPGSNHEVISIGGGQNNFNLFNNFIQDSFGGVFDAKDGVTNGYIHNNIIYRCDNSGIYVDAYYHGASNIHIYNNSIYNAPNTIGLECNGVNIASEQSSGVLDGVYIYNNLIYNNSGTGLRVANYSQGIVRNVVFTNNTIYNNGHGSSNKGGIYIEYTPATGIIVQNNIFSGNNSFQIRNDNTSTLITNNIIYGTQPYDSGLNFITQDPQFISTDYIDNKFLHLRPTSPAINSGSPSYFVPSFDYDGIPRPQGSTYDIGAYEYIQCQIPTCLFNIN